MSSVAIKIMSDVTNYVRVYGIYCL